MKQQAKKQTTGLKSDRPNGKKPKQKPKANNPTGKQPYSEATLVRRNAARQPLVFDGIKKSLTKKK